MKVLFLDFDGVLNSWVYFSNRSSEVPKDFMARHCWDIDPEAVDKINKIIEQTGAKVCISSSWRILYSLKDLKSFLETKGFKGEIVGITPDLLGKQRGIEISEWMHDLNLDVIESFVILDDSSDMAHLKDKLVQTSMETGLLDFHVEICIEMLGKLND